MTLVHSDAEGVSVPTGDAGTRAANPFACIECGRSDHRLGDGREAYPHRPDLFSKSFWFCACGAFVGCHPGTTQALGSPAGKATKRARMDAHAAFDPLWKSGGMKRSQAYKWLADALGIASSDCHISQMDAATAKRAASLSRQQAAPASPATGGDEAAEQRSAPNPIEPRPTIEEGKTDV